MNYVIIMFMLILLIPSMMFLINFLMSTQTHKLNEKKTPYECGFSPINKSSIPFSNSFFILTMLFLIFDIEITLMIPIISMMNMWNPLSLMMMLLFIMFMIISLIIEWFMKNLMWMI